ncbi:family 16 glycosylhydrolase [Marinimicrobium sp. ARAG 43.8]|uniref:family 16 glycosylhydrolase n=1 Tax=Marinimicrobium sp. ARAG 43.8 TaxID=3418719 RepID=UPI003CEC6CF9
MNNKMTKAWVLSALALTLTACGGSSSNDNASSSASSEPSSSSEPTSSSSSEPSSSSSSSVAAEWTLVWEDDFEGDAIDSSKWEHEVNCWGGGNNEAQCYTDSSDNSFVADGFLNIVAQREAEPFCGPATNQEDPNYDPSDTSVCKDYTSARLRTRDQGDWQYGRMEIRAKMPAIGEGVWPAIWMLPTDNAYGGWPHSGEIDIFEAFQPGVSGPQPTGEANEMHGTLHYGYSWPWNQNTGASYNPPENIWEEFHTYAIEWEEGEIRWYVDDVLFARNSGNWFSYYWGGQEVGYQVAGAGSDNPFAPFDQPFHMILNVALGNGDYVPLPTFDVTDDVTMAVDFVKVYECSANPETGKGCETPSANPGVEATDIVGHQAPPADWDVRWLYRDGLQPFESVVDGSEVTTGLTLGQYACGGDPWCPPEGSSVSATEPTVTDGPGGNTATVWDLDFSGVSNAFIIVGDALSDEALDFGGDISGNGRAANLGEIKFDLRVLDIDPETKLLVKLDSGYPNNSYHEIEIPPTGEWAEVAVRLYTLQPNINEGYATPVDFSSIKNPFVIEPVDGDAHVQIANVRIVCQDSEEFGDCDIKPEVPPEPITDDMAIFDGDLSPAWGDPGLGVWEDGGQDISIDVVSDVDMDGSVIELTFTPVGLGTFYIQSNTPKDLSAFSGGNLVFDLKVISNNGNTDGFLVKADCGHPCVGAEIPVSLPADNDWHDITVPIASIAAQPGFNIGSVDTPFSIWPVFGQQDVVFRVTNIRWELP